MFHDLLTNTKDSTKRESDFSDFHWIFIDTYIGGKP